jgi:lipase
MSAGLHLRRWGPEGAQRVVCLHGVTSWGGHFERLATETLAPAYRVLAPDLLGHGLSPHEPPWRLDHHLAAVLETVGDEAATWIGHSFGGRLALELAALRPDLVEGLVLLDPAIHVLPHVALFAAEGARADRSYATLEEAIERRLEESVLLPIARARVADEIPNHLVVHDDRRLRYRYSQAAVVAAYGELAVEPPPFERVRVPTLVVAGIDSYVPYGPFEVAHRDALGDLLEVTTVPGGHTVLWDAPDETAAAIVRFLARD